MREAHDILDSYYEEIDPVKRLTILNEYMSEAASEDPAAQYRMQLYQYRYTDPKDPERKVDKFMLAILDFLYLFKNSRILPGRNVKETRKILEGLEQDERVHSDPAFAKALKLEIQNAARRYFDTCKSDSYHKKFFGVAHSNADEKEKQRCLDAWRMSKGLAQRLGLEKEMALFCEAVSDEYKLSRVDGLSLEEAYRGYTASDKSFFSL